MIMVLVALFVRRSVSEVKLASDAKGGAAIGGARDVAQFGTPFCWCS